jgi:hypothetical protein
LPISAAARTMSAMPDREPRTICFRDLPDDMQVLIDDFVRGCDDVRTLPDRLPVIEVETAWIPEIALDPFDRGEDYALAMDLDETPPIIVAEGHFMDGKHRAHAARRRGRASLAAIDLTGIVDPHMLACNTMGRLLPPEATPAEPQSMRP